MHRPVKVYDQLGDAYKQVVNSHGVRRPVSRTLCACGFTTYVSHYLLTVSTLTRLMVVWMKGIRGKEINTMLHV